MENKIIKYLIENKQIRIYILSGEQIYHNVQKLDLNKISKQLFINALNITALSHSLNSGNQRVSFKFLSENKINTISTQSFSNNTITGIASLNETNTSFKNGTLQVISSLNNQLGNSYTSYSSLDHGELYKDIENYYFHSEQTPTYFIPLSKKDFSKNIILLIQPLPFTDRLVVSKVLRKIYDLKGFLNNLSISELKFKLSELFSNPFFLEEISIKYSCGCSKEMFLGMIHSLSKKEIQNVILNKEILTISCLLCGKIYDFSHSDIAFYMQ